MIPGPAQYYKCPKCPQIMSRGSIMSGNTFGSRLFSDGKRISPMLPEFPTITKCYNCDYIFWLNSGQMCGLEQVDPNQVKRAGFLDAFGLNEAIKLGLALNSKEEVYLRQRIIWSINDRVRAGQTKFSDSKSQSIWEENQLALIRMLDEKNMDEMILLIEVYRNMGKFYDSYSLVMLIHDFKLLKIKEAFTKQINYRNTEVFEIII